MNIGTIDQACKEAGVPLSNEQRCVIIGVLNGSAARYTISAGTVDMCKDVERAVLRAAKESGETIHKGKLVTEQDDIALKLAEGIRKTRQQEQDEGWIEWKGGECPVDGSLEVKVRFRDGNTAEGLTASAFYWCHSDDYEDIIAYKVIG